MAEYLNGDEESSWESLAHKHWLSGVKSKGKVKVEVIDHEIWEPLARKDFDHRSLLTLEGLQLLERYLWPGYDEESVNHHVLLIALIVTAKAAQQLSIWDIFADDEPRFSSFFRRILSLSIDSSLPSTVRIHLLRFLIAAFQSLDNSLVRKECAPLLSISIWHNLSSDAVREQRFGDDSHLKKLWRASAKRYEAADQETQGRLRFERNWLYTLLIEFIRKLQEEKQGTRQHCERFLEFLIDLESQLPTRRFVNRLIRDLNLLSLIKLSPLMNGPDAGLLQDLCGLLQHYVHFPINDSNGNQIALEEAGKQHCQSLARLQRIGLSSFKDKLTLLALANYGALERREELENHLGRLNDEELLQICHELLLRTTYPPQCQVVSSRRLMMEILLTMHEKKSTFRDELDSLNILPTDALLYQESLLRNEVYDGSRPLAIPKLNLQYLSVADFCWRAFVLHRAEQFFEIRTFLEEVVKKVKPTQRDSDGTTIFQGSSKVALPMTKPAILEAGPPRVGESVSAFIKAEITLNVQKLADGVRREWESLHADDTIFLLSIDAPAEGHGSTNGHNMLSRQQMIGLKAVRAAEVVQVLDESGRPLRNSKQSGEVFGPRPRIRRLIVNIDSLAFSEDIEKQEKGATTVYERMNLLVRRPRRENNFRRVLESIRDLAKSAHTIPSWLRDVFLGFGDPRSANYTNLSNSISHLDLQDTFQGWDHLVESFPGMEIEPSDGLQAGFKPPYVVEFQDQAVSGPKLSRKRRRDETDAEATGLEDSKIKRVKTYKKPLMGPYPSDAPKLNQIRFTPTQVQAIVSGTQPGLTVIVGPPGTGKTDVATQVISNLYHDFPSERTLLIAHSNQALNQLFQKIMRLDIDRRHLLRLGQGEGELETEENYGKLGRVESFLENRSSYLAEVDRLASNLSAPGAHGASCETAGYFQSVYVRPAWQRFWDQTTTTRSAADIASSFPFHQYFETAPQPLFPQDASKERVLEIARGCERHVGKIFSELEDIRPFEVLYGNKEKMNYLMVKEARIIAMTSTHAAMRRQEIADLGFKYDNVIMEEAAQITEVENFIPLMLQNQVTGKQELKRVVLCGDHLQNSPIIQNIAFQQYSNLDQSLFLRLVRLGVPTINLDAQGRARASIARLYKWRYPQLGNLQNVLTDPEFTRANAGFKYDYQFIDVPDYKGKGEQQPSPHFIQNLGEAEYAVAIYQYMRLLGYPGSKISIMTTYAGQKALIRDVLSHRCANNRLFGMPRIVTTVDKYQGEQNDYIILSLVRTSKPGYLRDLRRLTVALSRARLGLYILGRRTIFESSTELQKAFELPFGRPSNLMLTVNEMHPTQRSVDAEVEATEIVGVEHLGQHVYNMTQVKIEMLKKGTEILPPQESASALDVQGEEEDEVAEVQDGGPDGFDTSAEQDAEIEEV